MKNKSRLTSPVPVDLVHGDDWDQICENARRIAGLPDGIVTFQKDDPKSSYKYKETLHPAYKENVAKGAYYAYVVVTPLELARPEVPETPESLYTLDEIERALAEMNYYGASGIVAKMRGVLASQGSPRRNGAHLYTVPEMKRALRDTEPIQADWYGQKVESCALQVRKNRLADAHGLR